MIKFPFTLPLRAVPVCLLLYVICHKGSLVVLYHITAIYRCVKSPANSLFISIDCSSVVVVVVGDI